MEMPEYTISSVRMGGLVKETEKDLVRIHLRGRLGVLVVPRWLIRGDEEIVPGHELSFYFSYVWVVTDPVECDASELRQGMDPFPVLVSGTITEVNDTAARITVQDGLGTVAVPRRWLFTPVPLKTGLKVEFYYSSMDVTGMSSIPVESI